MKFNTDRLIETILETDAYKIANVPLEEVDLKLVEFNIYEGEAPEFEYRQFTYGSTSFVTKEHIVSGVVVGATLFSNIVDKGLDKEKTLVNAYELAILSKLLFMLVGDLDPERTDKAFARLSLFGKGTNFLLPKQVRSEKFTFSTKYTKGTVIIDIQANEKYITHLKEVSSPIGTYHNPEKMN